MESDKEGIHIHATDNVETYMVVDCPKFLKEDERDEKDTDII